MCDAYKDLAVRSCSTNSTVFTFYAGGGLRHSVPRVVCLVISPHIGRVSGFLVICRGGRVDMFRSLPELVFDATQGGDTTS